MKEFVLRGWVLQWRNEFAVLEVLVPLSYLQCVKGDGYFFDILLAFDTTECEIFLVWDPFWTISIVFFLWESKI